MSKFKIAVKAEKRALSANYIFSTTTPRPRGGKFSSGLKAASTLESSKKHV